MSDMALLHPEKCQTLFGRDNIYVFTLRSNAWIPRGLVTLRILRIVRQYVLIFLSFQCAMCSLFCQHGTAHRAGLQLVADCIVNHHLSEFDQSIYIAFSAERFEKTWMSVAL